ncbi:DMT family transporter [Neorhizobium sp. P12A]|uniref:DMT family transporter n=1 Tax=Neorhizobium sp. P12A TaxID=2268027 RepID=UPI0011EE6F30|nr:DMT family transporter [Neorhizobium sp. P12A]KAA0699266.1 DMT family transporter [Neorhizobium sp. P12A]
MNGRTYGILLVSIATVMWSSAGLFVRLLGLDTWTTLGWRSLFGGLTLLVISLYQNRRPAPAGEKHAIGLYLFAGFIAGLSMFGYIGALKFTSVANVLAIYATTPFICAGIAFLWMRERAERRVLIASGIALIGVLVVVGFAARPDDLAGNGLALLMTVSFAYLLIFARRHPTLKLAPVNAVGSGLCLLLSLPLMSHQIPPPSELAILAVFGSTTSGLAYLLFMTGSRHIQAAEAGLIGLLDIVLGPLWVYLAFGENPGMPTIIGGALILFSVVWYMWGRLRAARALSRQRLKNAA